MIRHKSPLDAHEFFHAFIGNRFERALHLMSEQGGELLSGHNIAVPQQSVSSLLYVAENQNASTADISAALNLPHQLVTQRLNALIEMNLAARRPDPNDGRRKIIRLTARGKRQVELLNEILRDANAAYDELNEELGVNLSTLVLRVIESLHRETLTERILRHKDSAEKKAG